MNVSEFQRLEEERLEALEALDEEMEEYHQRRLTRQEQLQELADRGVDTWSDYRGER